MHGCRTICTSSTAETTGSPNSPCKRTASSRRCSKRPSGGDGGRVGVFLGTSTAGILQTELAYRERDPVSGALPPSFEYGSTHNSFSVADYLRRRCRLEGPAVAVSCACASSAKVFGSARRMIEAGLIDAALVGGVDSLCLTTLYGFHSLQLTSPTPCRPFDVARDGISIGEAAAFALLERVPAGLDGGDVLLLGIGESSDAYHMSAPHPEGLGARRAMQAALAAAALEPGDIDYINLHGTGTPATIARKVRRSPAYSARPRLAVRPRVPRAILWARRVRSRP